MYMKLNRIFLFCGLLANSLALILGRHAGISDFQVGFLEGVAIALLAGSLYFFRRARKAGECEESRLCRWKRHVFRRITGNEDDVK